MGWLLRAAALIVLVAAAGIAAADAPPSDVRSGDTPALTLGQTVATEMPSATADAGDPAFGCGVPGGTAWYQWQSPATEERVVVDTIGSGFDTVVAVFEDGAPPRRVGCDDDATRTRQSRVAFESLGAGERYWIGIAGFFGATGPLKVALVDASGIPNDDAGFATDVGGVPFVRTGSTQGAWVEPDEPVPCGDVASTLWWRWTGTGVDLGGTVTASTVGSSFDTVLAVWQGPDPGHLSLVGCNDNVGGTRQSRVMFGKAGAQPYWFQVGGAVGARGDVRFELSAALPNDARETPTLIAPTLPYTAHASTVLATETPDDDVTCASITATLWWRWTATATEQVVLDTAGSDFDTALAVRRADDLSEVAGACSDDASGDAQSRVTLAAVAETEYLIEVGGVRESRGNLAFHLARPVANDNSSDAGSIVPGSTIERETTGASRNASERRECGEIGSTIWYRWTPTTRLPLIASTEGSTFDTVVAVWRGSDTATAALVGCSDDVSGTLQSRLRFLADPGVVHWIQVGGRRDAVGPLRLSLRVDPPVNDARNAATPASGFPWGVSVMTNGASAFPLEDAACGGSDVTVWYNWTAPFAGTFVLDAHGSAFATRLAVEPPTGPVACPVDGRVVFAATAGAQYLLRAGGGPGEAGDVVLHMEAPPANDAVDRAAALPTSGTVAQRDGGGSVAVGEIAPCGVAAASTVWFSWTAPEARPVFVDSEGSDHPVAIQVFRDVGGVLEDAGCAAPVTGAASVELAPTGPGDVFRLQVAPSDAARPGALRLNVRPPDDARERATVITALGPQAPRATYGATVAQGEPDPGCAVVGSTVWYAWTAPLGPANMTATTAGSTFDSVLAVYEDDATAPLACSDDVLPLRTSRLQFTPRTAHTYYFQVGGRQGASGDLVLSLLAPPPNDQRAGALPIPGWPAGATAVTTAATDVNDTVACGSIGSGLWWSWVGDAYERRNVTTFGSAFDTVLAVYQLENPPPDPREESTIPEGGQAAYDDLARENVTAAWAIAMQNETRLELVGCSDDAAGTLQSRVGFDARAGTTYWIHAGGYKGATGDLRVNLPQRHDLHTSNLTFTVPTAGQGALVTSSNRGASLERFEPTPCGEMGATVWWRATFSSARLRHTLTTRGSDFPSVLAIYEDGPDGETLVACEDGVSPHQHVDPAAGTAVLPDGLRDDPAIVHDFLAKTYVFQVGGHAAAEGAIDLTLAPHPVNDDRASPTALATGALATVSTLGATVEVGEPEPCGMLDATVWYRWTAPSTGGRFVAATSGLGPATMLAVHDAASGAPIGCWRAEDGSPNATVAFDAAPDAVYLLQAGGLVGKAGTLLVRIGPELDHDDVGAPYDLGGASVVTSPPFSSGGATAALDDPAPQGCVPTPASLWYVWRAPATARFVVDTIGSSVDTVMQVHTKEGSGFVLVGCEDDPFFPGSASVTLRNRARVEVEATEGTEYWILAGPKAGGGDIAIRVRPVPANDKPANAAEVPRWPYTVTVEVGGSWSDDRYDSSVGSCPDAAQSVWYSFTAPVAATVTVRATAADGLAAYVQFAQETPNGPRLSGCVNRQSNDAVVPGQTYLVRIVRAIGKDGLVRVDFKPANDDASATTPVLLPPWHEEGTNEGATRQDDFQGPEHACFDADRTVWYLFVPPASGEYEVSLVSAFDAVLGLTTPASPSTSPNTLDPFACAGPGSDLQARFPATAGGQYYIHVGGVDADAYGGFVLDVRPVVPEL
ncbi:MAG TPA: hypothetical protein VI997_09565 [Candidatus Thermoplasmatota archaeon]|nr:hypothetical protein [Candidatus Thermoplasmatota archaeon]